MCRPSSGVPGQTCPCWPAWSAERDRILAYLRAGFFGGESSAYRDVRDPQLDALIDEVAKPIRKLSEENYRLRSTDHGQLTALLASTSTQLYELRESFIRLDQQAVESEKKQQEMALKARRIDKMLHQVYLWLACEGGSPAVAENVKAVMYGEIPPDESVSPCGCITMKNSDDFEGGAPFARDELQVFAMREDRNVCVVECQKCGAVYDYLELKSWWTGAPYHLGYGKAP